VTRRASTDPDLFTIPVETLEGRSTSLARFRGQVLCIVNVASHCGFTPQYQALESWYRKYRQRGFAVLGFPCNQFGQQEPGSAEEIREFCSTTYQVSFPLFGKVEVNGPEAHPLFQKLKAGQPGLLGTEAIKWNFTKFLIDRRGAVVRRFAPKEIGEALTAEIEELLRAPQP
jgi:glutathione peroxidase